MRSKPMMKPDPEPAELTPGGPVAAVVREEGDFRSSDVHKDREERRADKREQRASDVQDDVDARAEKEGDAATSVVKRVDGEASATEGAAVMSPADGSHLTKHGKGLTAVHVVKHGDYWRVAEADGTWAGPIRARADGGGFAEERAAQQLAATINQRRLAAGRV